ncbi:MAG: penicillin-binding protein [Tenericutes bacterium]|nr:penicillin-binding protein [Mycoplasmatota bacterium]
MNNKLINKRFIFIASIFLIFLIIISIKLFNMQLFDTKKSMASLNKLSTKIVYGESKPRGRILDTNGNILVDNIGINKIVYKKENGIKKEYEFKIAYMLAEKLSLDEDKITDEILKKFWIANNKDLADKKITAKEYELYKQRKLKASKLEELKIKRVTKKEISSYNTLDKKAAYIYYLMHNGYSYDDKIIKEEITDEELFYVEENKGKLNGVSVVTTWKRVYPYGDLLKGILGSVSTSSNGIPKDKKTYYLKKGYSLNDRVGLSYLELEYEDELKGTKDKYEVKNGVKKLIKKGHRGNDIVLSIDINLQKEVEEILKEEILKAKSEANTNYYDHSSVIITDPRTGNILSVASKQVIMQNNDYKVNDYITSTLSLSISPGSVVKGASMLVGYKTGNLKFGDVYYDKCIKFKNTPKKCSWSNSLGSLNDITALKFSSNSYQFQLALKVAGVKYYYNMPVKIDSSALDTYRNVFKSLGLGSKTGIDLPNENAGYEGKESNAGLLLNYAIGQYDSYTIYQLASYINTIINDGDRLKLSLLKEIRSYTNDDSIGPVKLKYEKKSIDKLDLDKSYFLRVKEGFKSVMQGYLGRGYMGDIKDSAGKTGTSETFYDSDADKVVDTETYTKSFIGYAPADNPVMSIVSISPHVRVKNNYSNYSSNVNKRIVSRICNKFFEIYK